MLRTGSFYEEGVWHLLKVLVLFTAARVPAVSLNIFLNWELGVSSTLSYLLDPCRPSAGARCTETADIKLF